MTKKEMKKEMNKDNKITMTKKLRDAMFGLAIGDALGVPFEFMSRGSFECKGMEGFGTHSQPAGTWSDDTSMAIATAKSIKDNGGKINVDDIRANFLKWSEHEEFTAGGELFDMGIATNKALSTGKPCTGEYDNGNGSLMRILPLAFTDCTDDEIRAVSAITHGHRISTEACVIYVHVARKLLAGEKILDIIFGLRGEKPFDRLRDLYRLEEEDICSGGYVVDTLEASLWALANYHNYRDCVLAAVNLGSDTDTTGAVCGGLAGIMYGLEDDFAKECLETLRNKELIESCLWEDPSPVRKKNLRYMGEEYVDIKLGRAESNCREVPGVPEMLKEFRELVKGEDQPPWYVKDAALYFKFEEKAYVIYPWDLDTTSEIFGHFTFEMTDRLYEIGGYEMFYSGMMD